MDVRDFWYVTCESRELKRNQVRSARILGEWLVLVRRADGAVVAFQDRCMHRAGRLSKGSCDPSGNLRCPYHGWTYDADGELVAVPAEGDDFSKTRGRALTQYACVERDDLVFVRLSSGPEAMPEPVRSPHYGEKGWRTVRLVNVMQNSVTNCVENFIDIPHTVFVHPGIFRTSRRQRIEATVTRSNGAVHVTYRGETNNLGWFSRFLNPDGGEIEHSDHFYMPNVTSVHYGFGPRRQFWITSQSVPEDDGVTRVYTDLTFDYGRLNRLAAPIVRYQGQRVIDQDVVALAQQWEVIEKYGEQFHNTPADIIHVYVESIRGQLALGTDPRALPERSKEIVFWV